MNPKKVTAEVSPDNGSDLIPIPHSRWEAAYYVGMKLAKFGTVGLVVAVLCLVLYGVYLIQDKQADAVSRLVENQTLLVKAIDAKNEMIQSNHDLLVASQARDEQSITSLRETGMVQQEILATLRQANDMMSAVPPERKAATALLTEIRDSLAKQSRISGGGP